jgi:hypothetical protein
LLPLPDLLPDKRYLASSGLGEGPVSPPPMPRPEDEDIVTRVMMMMMIMPP